MTMTGTEELRAWRGHTVIDADGEKIGKVADIYFDEETDQPEWLAVSTCMFGSRVRFVPLAGAAARGDDLAVPFAK